MCVWVYVCVYSVCVCVYMYIRLYHVLFGFLLKLQHSSSFSSYSKTPVLYALYNYTCVNVCTPLQQYEQVSCSSWLLTLLLGIYFTFKRYITRTVRTVTILFPRFNSPPTFFYTPICIQSFVYFYFSPPSISFRFFSRRRKENRGPLTHTFDDARIYSKIGMYTCKLHPVHNIR